MSKASKTASKASTLSGSAMAYGRHSHSDLPFAERDGGCCSTGSSCCGYTALAAAVLLPAGLVASAMIMFQVLSVGACLVLGLPFSYVVWREAKARGPGFSGAAAVILAFVYAALVVEVIMVCRPLYQAMSDLQAVRIGAVSDTTANILVYAPGFDTFSVLAIAPNGAEIRSSGAVFGEAGTGVAELRGLEPRTTYELTTDLGTTGSPDLVPGPVGSFRTFPTAGSTEPVTLVSTSCLQRGRMIGGRPLENFRHVSDTVPDLDLFMFLGDTIYSDVPLGLGFNGIGYGGDVDLYRREYSQALSDPDAHEFLSKSASLFMFDDHEIVNDYAEGEGTDRFKAGAKVWNEFVGGVNPDSNLTGTAFHYTFSIGNAEGFVFDTRTKRDHAQGVIVGREQLDDVIAWLIDTNNRRPNAFKFLVSPVGFSRNANIADGNWNCGCPDCITKDEAAASGVQCVNELDELLGFIVASGVKNVVMVSGDAHKASVFELEPGLFEISASPLDALASVPWGNDVDTVLYEEGSLNSVFAVYKVDDEAVNVFIYGSPANVLIPTCAILFGTLFFELVFLLICMRCRDDHMPFSGILAVGGILVFGAISIAMCAIALPLAGRDGDFEQPQFTFRIDAA